MTISLRFFLEKRAIFLIFHCKYKSSTRPSFDFEQFVSNHEKIHYNADDGMGFM